MVNLVRVETEHTGLPGGPYLSVHNFNTGAGTADDLADLVEAFWTDLRTVIRVGLQMRVEPVQTIFDDSTGQPVGTQVAATARTVTGGDSNDQKSAATQGLLQLRTGVYASGREIRGRLFVPAPCETSGAATPTQAYIDTLTDAGTALVSASSGGNEWRVWSRARGQSAAVTACSGWNQYAVLRSRRD